MRGHTLPDKLAYWLGRLSQAIACGLLFGIFVLINIEVLCRYLFATSTLLADEYSAYFFAIMVYLGLNHAMLNDKLICIDLPASWSRLINSTFVRLTLAALGIAFNAILVYSMYLTTSLSARFQSRSIQPSQTLLLYPQTAVLIALCLAVLAAGVIFMRALGRNNGDAK